MGPIEDAPVWCAARGTDDRLAVGDSGARVGTQPF